MPERSPIPTSAQLGTAFRQLREERGLTIEDLAGMAGIHTTYLSEVERKLRNPSWEVVRAVTSAFEIDFPELLSLAETVAAAEPPGDQPASSPT